MGNLTSPTATVEAFCSGGMTEALSVGLAADMTTVLGLGIVPFADCLEPTIEQVFTKLATDEETHHSVCGSPEEDTTPAPSAASPLSFGVATTLALITVYMA